MVTTSPEPLLLFSLPSSSDRAAINFAVASGTTACTGDGAISVAAALETIVRGRNEENNRDDRDNGEGAADSVAVAFGITTAMTMSQRAIISSDAKSSLQAYFYFLEEEWPLNRALSRGADFFSC